MNFVVKQMSNGKYGIWNKSCQMWVQKFSGLPFELESAHDAESLLKSLGLNDDEEIPF